MLNLIYYDLKATIKKLWFYIILICVFAFIVRFLLSDAFMSTFNNSDFYIGTIITIVGIGFLCALGTLAIVVTIIVQTHWFDENLLSPQGQLTNMLPVSSLQIVLSKIICALFWSLLIMVLAIGIVSVVLVQTEYYEILVKNVLEVSINNNINIGIPGLFVSLGLCIATAITAIVSLCFLSQMIGQIFNSFRNLFVFISFLILLLITGYFQLSLANFMGITSIINTDLNGIISFIIASSLKYIIINAITITLYWLITSYILRRHLNLL